METRRWFVFFVIKYKISSAPKTQTTAFPTRQNTANNLSVPYLTRLIQDDKLIKKCYLLESLGGRKEEKKDEINVPFNNEIYLYLYLL